MEDEHAAPELWIHVPASAFDSNRSPARGNTPLLAIVLTLVFATAATLPAHVVGLSTTQGQVFGETFVLAVGMASADAQQFLPPEHRTGKKWTPEEFQSVHGLLVWQAPQLWEVREGDDLLTAREVRVELLPTPDTVNFRLLYLRLATDKPIRLRAKKLSTLPAGHRALVRIAGAGDSTVGEKLMTATDDTLEIAGTGDDAARKTETTPASGALPTAWGFVKLGIEHIWTGYDHLLFLFSLLIVCRTFRSIVAVISCFTVAHSLTLGVATLNLVNLPSGLVEPAIAASIVYVGAENLWCRGEEPRGRWALTFMCGLIHGFGFATVLRDLGVGASTQEIAMPLFSFNLGVEVGQIAIASVVLPIVWQLRKHESFVRRGVPALSAFVTLAGLYWLVQRTVLAARLAASFNVPAN